MNVVIKGYSGRSCYTEWANVVVKDTVVAVVTGIGRMFSVIKGYSGCSCYRDWANIVIKGYSGCSYYSALKNVLVLKILLLEV